MSFRRFQTRHTASLCEGGPGPCVCCIPGGRVCKTTYVSLGQFVIWDGNKAWRAHYQISLETRLKRHAFRRVVVFLQRKIISFHSLISAAQNEKRRQKGYKIRRVAGVQYWKLVKIQKCIEKQ